MTEIQDRNVTVPTPRGGVSIVDLLADIGRGVFDFGRDILEGVAFFGEFISSLGKTIVHPGRFRWTALFFHIEVFAFRSVPIIALINFLVGAIVAQQGIYQLKRFGAVTYAADLIGVLILRELGVLLTSIMLAGRSGSAITAEIGSMKMREEIDALQVMGLRAMEVLIVPRLLGLIISLPLLTFIADMAGIAGRRGDGSALRRLEPGRLSARPAGGDRHRNLFRRPHQGPVHGPDHRSDRRDRRTQGRGIGGVARPSGHSVRRQGDLHGHRRRRTFRGVLRGHPFLGVWILDSAVLDFAPSRQVVEPEPVAVPAIRVRDLVVGFGDKIIMEGLDLDVRKGEVMGFVGGSGMGKSVLTRAILGLVRKRAGSIAVFGEDIDTLKPPAFAALQRRFGVMFQQGALLSGLTVKQNVQIPMREHLHLSPTLADQLAMLKIDLVGLPPDAADKKPSELSGGMIKRAALARALALDPELLFLDEPTSGLDPVGAADFDDLIATLQKTLGLTVFMVTHDLDSLYAICDRIAALADKKVIATGTMETMLASDHPWLRAYFHGKRARRFLAPAPPEPPRAPAPRSTF